MHFSRIASAVAIAFLCTAPAHSGPLLYGTYYEDVFVVSACNNVSGCRVDFSQTPSDKLVKIKHIHCSMNGSAAVGNANFSIAATSGGASLGRTLPLQLLPVNSGSTAQSDGHFRFTINVQTEFLVGQGRFPYVAINAVASGSYVLACSITGEPFSPV